MNKSTAVAPTAEEVTLAQISREQFDRYKEVLAPFEDEFLRESRISPGEKKQMQGIINADVQQAIATKAPVVSSANNKEVAARDLALTGGKAMSEAQVEGNIRAENADVEAIKQGIQMGRGQAIEAMSGLGTQAASSTSRAINNAFNDQQDRDMNAELAGSAAGVVAYGAGKIKKPTTDKYGIPLDSNGDYQFDP